MIFTGKNNVSLPGRVPSLNSGRALRIVWNRDVGDGVVRAFVSNFCKALIIGDYTEFMPFVPGAS